MTGRYHLRSNVHGVTAGREMMSLSETTIADKMRAAGYRTGMFGKWHLGMHYPYVPHARGFEELMWIDSDTEFDPAAVERLLHELTEFLRMNLAFDIDARRSFGGVSDGLGFGLFLDGTHNRFFVVFSF